MFMCGQIQYLRGVIVSEEWPSRILDEICRLLKKIYHTNWTSVSYASSQHATSGSQTGTLAKSIHSISTKFNHTVMQVN